MTWYDSLTINWSIRSVLPSTSVSKKILSLIGWISFPTVLFLVLFPPSVLNKHGPACDKLSSSAWILIWKFPFWLSENSISISSSARTIPSSISTYFSKIDSPLSAFILVD